MELRTISPRRDFIDEQLRIKAQEIKDFYENEIQHGMDVRTAYALCREAMSAETDKYLPEIMRDIPVFVLAYDIPGPQGYPAKGIKVYERTLDLMDEEVIASVTADMAG